MITDNNINSKQARFWCIFCSKKGKGILNEGVMMRMANPDKDLERAQREYDSMTDAQKAASDMVFKLRQKNGSRLANEMKYVVNGMDQKAASDVAVKLVADVDAKGEKTAASMLRELGQTYMEPEKVMPDGSRLVTPAADSNLVKGVAGKADVISGKSKGWLGRVWDVVKGYFSSIKDTVSEWFIGGKWEGASIKEKLGMIGTGGLHSLELIAIAYLVYKIRGWLFPQLKLAWKNVMSGKDLAKCQFSDIRGNSYLCWFDRDEMKWQVKYDRGVKALLHRDDLFMSKDEADSFFATKFFAKFVDQCKKYIMPYLDVKRSEEQLKNKDTPGDVKKMLQFIVDNAEAIKTNMFGRQYTYFDESKNSLS